MKYTYGFCLFLFLVCSCSKNEEGVDWSDYQSIALLNDTLNWKAERCWFAPYTKGSNEVGLHLKHFNQFGELREQIYVAKFLLRIGKIPLKYRQPGTPTIEPTSRFFTYAADGDALTETYDLLEAEGIDNHLIIDWISEDSTEVIGTYELTFVISEFSPPKFIESRPDTLTYTNGQFKARLLLPQE